MNKSLEELHIEWLTANNRGRAAKKEHQDAKKAESVAWAAYKKRVDSAYSAAFKMGAQDE